MPVAIPPFSLGQLPHIEFGQGALAKLPAILASYGRHVLLVSGANSLTASPIWPGLCAGFGAHDLSIEHVRIAGEPSPHDVDRLVNHYRDHDVSVVCAIGGGSVLDAGKAIAGLLQVDHPVSDFLEGVGPELPYPGPATPFIAVPTTAGTGSEATKNAVLSTAGKYGYKKSFRHDSLVARVAVVDPDLLESCQPALIAANGMDALTQLLESYVSLRANAFSDALAQSGLESVAQGLLPWYENVGDVAAARSHMAYAALLSGITLAQVGLGSVHGLASPLGAFFPIPHGVVCGTLVAVATRVNIAALEQRAPDSLALAKYAQAGRILSGETLASDHAARARLVELLESWTVRLQLPRLAEYGVAAADFARVVANSRGSSMKTNPLVLSDAEITQILAARV